MKSSPKIIVITGAESTGKTTLTNALAKHFNVPFIPEVAREIVEKLGRKYRYEDVESIARIQIEKFKELATSDHPYVFIDTWLLNTMVWFEEVFDKTPEWLEQNIKEIKIDLFLVCDIDLPWVYDPVRENGGKKRILLHNKYIQKIISNNFKYKVISGINENRFNMALDEVIQL